MKDNPYPGRETWRPEKVTVSVGVASFPDSGVR
ncbi:MAG: hypothetical protein XU12_C0011G0041 [Deltaproteobacteria bacterium CSP1-8]|nr:MAG: hypothetical protein XU12_C0011G0041 [Deltaproteobacteria bacterium CSP1-8]